MFQSQAIRSNTPREYSMNGPNYSGITPSQNRSPQIPPLRLKSGVFNYMEAVWDVTSLFHHFNPPHRTLALNRVALKPLHTHTISYISFLFPIVFVQIASPPAVSGAVVGERLRRSATMRVRCPACMGKGYASPPPAGTTVPLTPNSSVYERL